MNNIMIWDHHGLFIYINLGYTPRSYHNVNIIHHSTIYREWCEYFTHWDDYFNYFLIDPRYLGEEMFIMRRMGKQKLPPNGDHGAITVYNKMHVGFKVQMERGINQLKQKWKHLMKRFDATKPKSSHLFRTRCSPHQLTSPLLDGLHI
jgi:hypothetical protein